MADFDDEIATRLKHHLAHAPINLRNAIEYSALAPGKRIRPKLLLAVGQLLGAPAEPSLNAAIALELIHCFTLIHDDLPCMDDDDFRRGRPSNHKVHGEGVALLAGDAIIPLAFEILLASPNNAPHPAPNLKIELVRTLAHHMGALGVIGGQASELLLTPKSTLAELRAMHAAKTGALFVAAVDLGRILGGLDADSTGGRHLIAFGVALGVAFQVADDVEDSET
ncbi:MAG: polyprenyl synthetase family protein, partial [Bdellovibrionota bacterium]